MCLLKITPVSGLDTIQHCADRGAHRIYDCGDRALYGIENGVYGCFDTFQDCAESGLDTS